MTTLEQQARDLLERIGVEDAQSFTAGDLVELANLIGAAIAAPAQPDVESAELDYVRATIERLR